MDSDLLIDDLSKTVASLPSLICDLDKKIIDTCKQMKHLKDEGLIYATEYWRPDSEGNPKYFYLNYPQQPGKKRERVYIGTDEKKILAAQASRERAKEYDELALQLKELRLYTEQIHRDLSNAKRHLEYAVS